MINNISNVTDLLKELSPKELETIEKVVLNIQLYNKFYATMTNHIFSKYPDIDLDKLEKISADIDEYLANTGHGEVLLVYNKLNEPFVKNFIRIYVKPEKLEELKDPIQEINTLILATHPDINMKIIEKLTKDIETKVNKLNLKYEEKWLLYNYLGHIYLLDLIETIGE